MYKILKWLISSKNNIAYHNGQTDKDQSVAPWSELDKDDQDNERAEGRSSTYHRSYHGWQYAQGRQRILIGDALRKYGSDNDTAREYIGRAMHTLQDRFAHRRSFDGDGNLTRSGPIFDENGEKKYEAKYHTKYNDKWNLATKWIRDTVVIRSYTLLVDFATCYMDGKGYVVVE